MAFQTVDFEWDLATTFATQIPWFDPVLPSKMEAGGLAFLVRSNEGEAILSPLWLFQGKGRLTGAFFGKMSG